MRGLKRPRRKEARRVGKEMGKDVRRYEKVRKVRRREWTVRQETRDTKT